MAFLEDERDDSMRLSERAYHSQIQANETVQNYTSSAYSTKQSNCCIHQKPGVTHTTEKCRNFLGLSINEKYELLKTKYASNVSTATKKVNASQLNVQCVPEAIIMNCYADMEQI